MSFPHPAYPAQPGYAFDYRSPQSPNAHHYYSSPRYSVFQATPSPRGSPKTHTRRASHFEGGSAYQYSARVPPGHSSPSARYFAPQQSTPLRNPDNVSGFDHVPGRTSTSRRPRTSTGAATGNGRGSSNSKSKYDSTSSYWRYHEEEPPFRRSTADWCFANGVHFVDDDVYGYDFCDIPPPYEQLPRFHHYPYASAGTDPRFYHDQVPQYTERTEKETTPKANQSRTRRASASYANTRSASHQQQQPPPPKPKPAKEKPATRKATEEDARRAGIPAGYSYKNWNPDEEPITLLGSVFDANSLGKWIYDWTVFSYGPATPMTDIAGDLWLLLIQLAGKVKRADDTIDLVRQDDSRELIEEFLESGERLWVRFKKLLKLCEEYMWKAAKKESGEKKPVSMGKNSGVEFVDSIFGRDRELEKTEKLMSAIRLWSMRFDANCNEILKNPAA